MESKEEKCKCNGTFLIEEGGKRVFCQCFIEKYLKSKLKILGISSITPEAKEFASSISMNGINRVLISAPDRSIEEVKGVIACMWVKYNISSSLEQMNCYRLVDIYLGKDLEYSNLPFLVSDILVLFVGYKEFHNSRIPDFILHMLESRRDKVNWIVTKDPKENMDSVKQYIYVNDFNILHFTGVMKSKTSNLLDM